MSKWRRFCLALASCVLSVAATQSAPLNAEAAAAPALDRQILVMVRHPPDHFRPNSSYGGAYGDQISQSERENLARRIARQYGLALVENWPMPMIGVDCFVMSVPDGRSITATAEQLSHDANVSWAQPMQMYGVQGAAPAPNDPLYAAEPAAKAWHLADLHRISTGRGIKIAVIDSGIEANHPDLSGQLIVNRNFVNGHQLADEQHGTGVAGIIAAKADNGIGIAGIAPGARLLGLRACWQSRAGATVCDTLSLAKAIYFAADQKADVINLSLSGPQDRLLGKLLKAAQGRGSTVVAAFDRSRPDGGFPASLPGVVAVSDASLAPSHGDVYIAPGRDVPTTQPGGRWFIVNGSSYAAAHVSGLLALIRERRRSSSLVLISQWHGGGVIDACATMVRVAGACDCACSPTRYASAGARR